MNSAETRVAINLDQAVYVLSGGLDFVGIDDVQHGKRVAYMALETARRMGWDKATRRDLYYAALIHDLGVSSTKVHRHLINELEWDHAREHCELAADLLEGFRPLAHLSGVLRHHHTHWQKLSAASLATRDALLANLIFLCDRVDAIRAQSVNEGDADIPATVRRIVLQHRGEFFSPELVDNFNPVAEAETFWKTLEPKRLEEWFAAQWPPDPNHTIGIADIRDLGRLFAHVVDAKSPYTARHSEGVAQLACYLARRLGLPREQQELIDVAALLHDLGKLRVPDAILDKPAPLDPAEWAIMQRHAQDSYDLLQRIDGFRAVATWAGLHHETLNGEGYPEYFRREALPLPARIISVADVFQALAQDRPYRPGLSPSDIVPVLQREADKNHLDRDIVRLVVEDLENCWEAAVITQPASCPPDPAVGRAGTT